jgi:hypothetical protein
MTRYRFFVQLLALNLVLFAALAALIHFAPYFAEHQGFYLISTAALALLTIVLFEVGLRTHQSPNLQLFGQVFLGSIGFKMLITLFILIVYLKKYPPDPDDKIFVLPFFAIYIAFTAYEIYFLTILGKKSEESSK